MKTLQELLALAETDDGKQQIRVMVAERLGAKWWAVHQSASTLSFINLGARHRWLECNGPLASWWINDDVPRYHTSRDTIIPRILGLFITREDESAYSSKLTEVLNSALSSRPRFVGCTPFDLATADAIHHCIALLLISQPA